MERQEEQEQEHIAVSQSHCRKKSISGKEAKPLGLAKIGNSNRLCSVSHDSFCSFFPFLSSFYPVMHVCHVCMCVYFGISLLPGLARARVL